MDKLIPALREDAEWAEANEWETPIALSDHLKQAADAIEELSAHYCPHMIRNVHDRGDDSLCRVLGAEPPKEE